MKKVLVIGASGMVASRFIDLVKDNLDITPVDEKKLDITDSKAVEDYFVKNNFDSVVNFAAFTNVDAAEIQRGDQNGLVWRLNVTGPENLVRVCKEKNVFLVQISTDFVFPGTETFPGPYSEDTELPDNLDGSMGWYSWTKNRAEDIVQKSGVRNAIVRISYPFRGSNFEAKRDWARNLINLYNEQKLYPLFDDQIQNILFVDDLVEPLTKIISEELIGIFHIVSGDTTTPYEAGSYLLEKYTGKPVDIQKGSMTEFLKVPGRTPRPHLGGINVIKTQKSLNMKFKTWREMVDEFIGQISSK